jgi:glycosyltransferase involved in cell wall biosynthesis
VNPIIFIGEGWLGSCGRSFREALARQGILVEDVVEEGFFPKLESYYLRGGLRLVMPLLRKNFEAAILSRVRDTSSKLVITYKGTHISAEFLRKIKDLGSKTVNLYPDASPIAHGKKLSKALGEYDLVVSTKIWHPNHWKDLFGYTNPCRFVAQGYDPCLHYKPITNRIQPMDVTLVATYRVEYGKLIIDLAKEKDLNNLNVAIYGYGWDRLRNHFPKSWRVCPAVHGYAYVRALLDAKVCIAPVTRNVVIGGKRYPGDEDTTRTYELPALGAFSIHQRTGYVQGIFDENKEVPMFDDAKELAENIMKGLSDEGYRLRIREAAHERSVPRDSLDNRAKEFLKILREKGIMEG